MTHPDTGVALEITYGASLSNRDRVESSMRTVNGDKKDVFAIEWNEDGDSKSDTSIGSTALVTAVADPFFTFKPKRSHHSFKSITFDMQYNLFYN